MASEWHYSKNGEKRGPVPSQRLKELAASGELGPNDLVWKEGMTDWKPASALKGLFPASETRPAGPPPLPPLAQSPTADGPTTTPPRQPDFFDKARGLAEKAKATLAQAQAKAEIYQKEAQEKYVKTVAQAKERLGQPAAPGVASPAVPTTPNQPSQAEGSATPPRQPSLLDIGRGMVEKAQGHLAQMPTSGRVIPAAVPGGKEPASGYRVVGFVGAGVLLALFLVCGVLGSLFKSGGEVQSEAGSNSVASPGAAWSSLPVDRQKEIYQTYCKHVAIPLISMDTVWLANQGTDKAVTKGKYDKERSKFKISQAELIGEKYHLSAAEVSDIFEKGEREKWFDKKKWPDGLSWDSL